MVGFIRLTLRTRSTGFRAPTSRGLLLLKESRSSLLFPSRVLALVSQLWKLKLAEQTNVAEIVLFLGIVFSQISEFIRFLEGSECNGRRKRVVEPCFLAPDVFRK